MKRVIAVDEFPIKAISAQPSKYLEVSGLSGSAGKEARRGCSPGKGSRGGGSPGKESRRGGSPGEESRRGGSAGKEARKGDRVSINPKNPGQERLEYLLDFSFSIQVRRDFLLHRPYCELAHP